MDRHMRNTKTVDYSQFLELDNDDEDFASSAPLTKKARVETKREKKEKPTKKTHRQENTSPKNSQGKRVPLDEKLYQRDLGVALALSVQKTTAVVENNENTPPNGLDEITDGNEELVIGRSRRQAASKALAEQRKLLTDDSGDEEAADDFKPDAADVDSESDSSYSGEDEEFEIKKPKKISTHKVAKQNVKGGKKDKDSPKPKTAAAPSSTTVSIKINPTQAKAAPVISPAPAKQTVLSSKPVGMKRPAWTPPASSEMVSSLLGGGAVRSPNQGLRLGLSRLARVKPLHPEAVIR
ncbi:RAD51-associated protein 1 isoform X3 [Pseudophryne corroboree]|uniref:RAD51-associated protein 1 isoform X3 n=1 Tax=Pseudophryne corroboree TaxID=495146 RepID=UPI00308204D5